MDAGIELLGNHDGVCVNRVHLISDVVIMFAFVVWSFLVSFHHGRLRFDGPSNEVGHSLL